VATVSPKNVLDPQACYKALQTRDARFDGRLFVGVTSTGVYCRPVCPARPPKPENCRFFPSAAAAGDAGFRPCLRCRPETAPDRGSWLGTSNTVSRGLALIAEGELDENGAGVDRLAERLGVGSRQLRRLFQQHLGASPIAVAQTQRILFAKQLIHETRLPMAEIAFAAGFTSVRRYNEVFHELFGRPPSALRRRNTAAASSSRGHGAIDVTGVTLRLRYRPPYDWPAMLAHLGHRAVPGVERVVGGTYARTVEHAGQTGTVVVAHEPNAQSLTATVRFPSVRALPAIVARIRRVFDVAADVTAIGAHLARDPVLAPFVAARPGLRTPGAWDGFELAVRAVLGQQVSVPAARELAFRLACVCAGATTAARDPEGPLTYVFPTAHRVARLTNEDRSALGVPGARLRALVAVAEAAVADPLLFEPRATVDETVSKLRAIPGVGDWTAHIIALRAGREPDAFPSSDRGLLRGAARASGATLDPAGLLGMAERWRPWRAYAAQHLWAADADSGPLPREARR
jgi:AraC family transcriptional regulator, regulatory protein of adaptative response / DNA-3-methyladenine glycosylase II